MSAGWVSTFRTSVQVHLEIKPFVSCFEVKTFVCTVSLYLALILGHQIVGYVVPILQTVKKTSPLYKILENSEGLEFVE